MSTFDYDFNAKSYAPSPEQTVAVAEFWPAVSTEAFCREYRIPSDMPAVTVESALNLAYIAMMAELGTWKAEQVGAGFASLAAVPAEKVNGISVKEWLFLRAVYCTAKAQLMPENRSMSRKAEADMLAKSDPEMGDDYHAQAATALRRLIGSPRVGVYLA
ncbi:MAG: hypothetical protein RL095_2172 [Verrucomicrobiota bacterium]|jgi:hypothetical protein